MPAREAPGRRDFTQDGEDFEYDPFDSDDMSMASSARQQASYVAQQGGDGSAESLSSSSSPPSSEPQYDYDEDLEADGGPVTHSMSSSDDSMFRERRFRETASTLERVGDGAAAEASSRSATSSSAPAAAASASATSPKCAYFTELRVEGNATGANASDPNAPAPRGSHTAFLVGDGVAPEHRQTLVVFGGHHRSTRYDDVRALDLKTMAWSQPTVNGETAGLKRVGAASAVVDGRGSGGARAVLFGGTGQDGAALNDVMFLTVTALPNGRFSYTWGQGAVAGTSLPRARRGASLTAESSGGRFILFGGYGDDGTELDDSWALAAQEPREEGRFRWIKLEDNEGTPPSVRKGHSATLWPPKTTNGAESADRIVIIGGSGGGNSLNDVKVATVGGSAAAPTLTWEAWAMEGARAEGAPAPREGHATVLFGEEMLVYGGCDVRLRRCYADLSVLDLKARSWRTRDLSSTTSPRSLYGSQGVGGAQMALWIRITPQRKKQNRLLLVGGCNDVTDSVSASSDCAAMGSALLSANPNAVCRDGCENGGSFQAGYCNCATGFSGPNCKVTGAAGNTPAAAGAAAAADGPSADDASATGGAGSATGGASNAATGPAAGANDKGDLLSLRGDGAVRCLDAPPSAATPSPRAGRAAESELRPPRWRRAGGD